MGDRSRFLTASPPLTDLRSSRPTHYECRNLALLLSNANLVEGERSASLQSISFLWPVDTILDTASFPKKVGVESDSQRAFSPG